MYTFPLHYTTEYRRHSLSLNIHILKKEKQRQNLHRSQAQKYISTKSGMGAQIHHFRILLDIMKDLFLEALNVFKKGG